MLDEQKTTPELSISTASISDLPVIQELALKIWPQTYSSIITKEQIDYMLDMMYSEESLKIQMNDGCEFILVSENSYPIGFASYREPQKGIYKLDKIYILLAEQGKGTGKLVISYIIQQIKNKGAVSLQLQVNRNNVKAKSFYEKIGFTVIKEADVEIGNGFFMNDYVMEKQV